MTRYLSGLCLAGLGLCGGGWLVVAAVAFGGQGGEAGRVNAATGAGLMLAACVTGVAWAVAWRRRMRADGVLGDGFLLVSRRQARRNRRELARDIRRTARQSKRAARRSKSETDGPAQPAQPGLPADGEFLGQPAYLGITVYEHGPDGHALNEGEPGAPGASSTGSNGTRLTSSELTATEPNGFRPDGYQGGHDGASAVDETDVLGELRTLRVLLAPLLAGTGSALEPLVRSPHQQAAPPGLDRVERPERSRPGAAQVAGDDEVLRVADSEEAWW